MSKVQGRDEVPPPPEAGDDVVSHCAGRDTDLISSANALGTKIRSTQTRYVRPWRRSTSRSVCAEVTWAAQIPPEDP